MPARVPEQTRETPVTQPAKPCPFCNPLPERIVIEKHKADAFNLGLNDGAAAGQTVPHVHLHLIPCYRGDLPDPRGGVRWVIPERARYWRKP
jgi:diadenosine tetraphosphate (Ap4A) HIT family hydrolase